MFKKIKNIVALMLGVSLFAGILTGCSVDRERLQSALDEAASDMDALAEYAQNGFGSESGLSDTDASSAVSSESEAASAEIPTATPTAAPAAGDPSSYTDISSSCTYYYDQMEDARKAVYSQILDGIASREASFDITCESTDDIEPALQGVLMDHPEFFWMDGEANIYGETGKGKEKITLTFNVDPSQIDSIQSQIDAKVNDFLASIPASASSYTIARAAYQYVIRNTDYGSDVSQNQNIQSVFLSGRSVCAGYAKAYQYLCHRAGIPCAYLTGTITTSGANHAWNMVTLDGTNTLVDPTWGDPTYNESETDSRRLDIIYDYFCLTTDELTRAHHTFSTKYAVPDCTSTSYDFYRLLGDYMTSYDGQTIQDHLYATVRNGESVTYLKFENASDYETALSELFIDGGLITDPLQEKMKKEGTNSIQYYYSKSDELRTIKIFW